MCMIENRQQFIATVDNMSMAALIHDVISIQSNGMNVKTNFNYTKIDLVTILCLPQLLDTKSIKVDWKGIVTCE